MVVLISHRTLHTDQNLKFLLGVAVTAANTQTRPTEVYLWQVCRGVPSEREDYQFADS